MPRRASKTTDDKGEAVAHCAALANPTVTEYSIFQNFGVTEPHPSPTDQQGSGDTRRDEACPQFGKPVEAQYG